LFLTDAIAKNKQIKNISTHHEQAAGYAAVAHSQYTEKLSACVVSTGCAGTNALTPVLSAWQDGVPTIFISGQNILEETTRYTGIPIRTFGQQEADIIRIVESITKYSVMLTDPNQIGIEMDKLISVATTGRKGPVWLDVPLDVQSMQIEPDSLQRNEEPNDEDTRKNEIDLDNFNFLLNKSKSPLLLIGHGVRSADAVSDLKKLIDKTKIPIIYTASAVDTIGSGNKGSIGSIGIMGCSRAAAQALQQSDLVVILGSRMNSMITGPNFEDFGRNAKVVLVDIDDIEHSKKERQADLFLELDIKDFLQKVNANVSYESPIKWTQYCESLKKSSEILEDFMIHEEGLDLYQISESLSKQLPANAVVVTDSGLIELILPTNIRFKNGQRCLHPISQGAMGYALPAAVGAHYASQSPIFAIVGDGSIMMNLQELQTITYNKVPVKIIVINNNAYSIIRKRQTELFRSRTIGTDSTNGLSCPEFKRVADCFEIHYLSANTLESFELALLEADIIPGPVMIEVQGVKYQDYIQIARARDSEGRLRLMPIENQSPFLVNSRTNSQVSTSNE
jgi:acetolactate synthase-1/2/3 large subunit